MADPSLLPDNDDCVPEPDRVWSDRNRRPQFWVIRERIETDRLYENSLQQRIIKRLRSAGTGQPASRD